MTTVELMVASMVAMLERMMVGKLVESMVQMLAASKVVRTAVMKEESRVGLRVENWVVC